MQRRNENDLNVDRIRYFYSCFVNERSIKILSFFFIFVDAVVEWWCLNLLFVCISQSLINFSFVVHFFKHFFGISFNVTGIHISMTRSPICNFLFQIENSVQRMPSIGTIDDNNSDKQTRAYFIFLKGNWTIFALFFWFFF